jgi:hypothetical protein
MLASDVGVFFISLLLPIGWYEQTLTLLTASRQGGVRIEREKRGGKWLIHNYGAGGTGYQASWYVLGNRYCILIDNRC